MLAVVYAWVYQVKVVVYAWVYQLKAVAFEVCGAVVLVVVACPSIESLWCCALLVARVFYPFFLVVVVVVASVVQRIHVQMQMKVGREDLQG